MRNGRLEHSNVLLRDGAPSGGIDTGTTDLGESHSELQSGLGGTDFPFGNQPGFHAVDLERRVGDSEPAG